MSANQTPRPRSRSRRTALLVLCLALVAGLIWAWPGPPRAAGPATGDQDLLDEIGDLSGFRRLSIAAVELDGRRPEIRYAALGADEHTRYEAGSVTKALTGLVVADAVEREELNLDAVAGDLLALGDGDAARATVRQLVTHTSGLPPLDRGTQFRGLGAALIGLDPYRSVDTEELVDAASSTPTGEQTYAYSNLGAALAGQATARAAGLSYPELMRTRLFEPLGLRETQVQTETVVPSGRSQYGRRMQPWVFHGYAPAGGVVTTSADLAAVATALLEERAPGMTALEPLADDPARPGRRVGTFWQLSERDGRTITWHNGRTGGYSSFVGLDRERRRAVVVLADVSTEKTDQLGMRLARG